MRERGAELVGLNKDLMAGKLEKKSEFLKKLKGRVKPRRGGLLHS